MLITLVVKTDFEIYFSEPQIAIQFLSYSLNSWACYSKQEVTLEIAGLQYCNFTLEIEEPTERAVFWPLLELMSVLVKLRCDLTAWVHEVHIQNGKLCPAVRPAEQPSPRTQPSPGKCRASGKLLPGMVGKSSQVTALPNLSPHSLVPALSLTSNTFCILRMFVSWSALLNSSLPL